MRLCNCSDSIRPSAWTTLWRWSCVSAPLPLAARDPLSFVRSSLISGFYSLAVTRAGTRLSRSRALARQQVRRPGRRRAVGAAHLVGVAARELVEQLAV